MAKNIKRLIHEYVTLKRKVDKVKADLGVAKETLDQHCGAIKDWMERNRHTYLTYAAVGATFKLSPASSKNQGLKKPSKEERHLCLGRMVCHDPSQHGNEKAMIELGLKAIQEIYKPTPMSEQDIRDSEGREKTELRATLNDPAILANRIDLGD
ncbi:hypothetical protein QOT17_025448 [Balamuthia mandrillaris]